MREVFVQKQRCHILKSSQAQVTRFMFPCHSNNSKLQQKKSAYL